VFNQAASQATVLAPAGSRSHVAGRQSIQLFGQLSKPTLDLVVRIRSKQSHPETPAELRGRGTLDAIHRWYTGLVATSHPRIQVTEDPELARALRAAAPHLPAGLSRSRQVRELAIAGARHIADEPPTEEQRTMLLEGLAESFMKPETAGIDWDLLRDGKLRAWPVR
jgi:hypothetical protein